MDLKALLSSILILLVPSLIRERVPGYQPLQTPSRLTEMPGIALLLWVVYGCKRTGGPHKR